AGTAPARVAPLAPTQTVKPRQRRTGGDLNREHGDPAWVALRRHDLLDAEGRVLPDDHAFERTQLLTGLETKLLDELAARVLVGPERLALAARPVERQHLEIAETLPCWVAVRERGQLGEDVSVAADLQLRVEP